MTTNEDLRQQFIDGMSLVASTVNIITTDGKAGRAGVTVSAMTSVSADGDAPTMLVCVHHLSAAADAIIKNGCFCANLLRDDQSYISDTFAGRIKTANDDKFSCTQWQPMKSGALRATNPLAAFDCDILSEQRVGTHYLFIGKVREVYLSPFGRPLIYANRAYSSSVQIWQYPTDTTRQVTYRIGSLDAFGPHLLPPLLRKLRDDAGINEVEIYEGDQRYLLDLLRAGTIDFAFLYDFQLGEDIHAEIMSTFTPYILLAEDHRLAGNLSVSLSELLEEPFVLLDAPPSVDYFLSLFDGVGKPFIAYRAKSAEMVQGMVAHGLGYGLLTTKHPPSHYGGKTLISLPLSGGTPLSGGAPLSGGTPLSPSNGTPLGMALCRRNNDSSRPADELFVNICTELLRDSPSQEG